MQRFPNQGVTGHVEVKKGYWHMIFNNGFDKNGKRIRWSKTTGLPSKGNKRKAETLLRAHLEQVNDISQVSEDLLFDQLISKWLKFVSVLVTENTLLKYQYAAKHLIPYFKNKRVTITRLTPIHISDYYIEKCHSNKRKGLSANTLLTHRTVMIGALQYAIDYLGIIKENIALKVAPPKKEAHIPSFYTEVQINEVFRKVQDEIIAPAVYLAASYGLRRSEVLGIKWKAINFEANTLTISHTVVRTCINGEIRIIGKDKVKRSKSYRSFPIPTHIKQLLITSLNQRYPNGTPNPTDYIFVGQTNQAMDPDYLSRTFRKLLADNGLRPIRFHDIRHTCAGMLINARVSLPEIQQWMGHSCTAFPRPLTNMVILNLRQNCIAPKS